MSTPPVQPFSLSSSRLSCVLGETISAQKAASKLQTLELQQSKPQHCVCPCGSCPRTGPATPGAFQGDQPLGASHLHPMSTER